MKSLLAKTLTSTALVLVTFTAAHAGNHNQRQSPFPAAGGSPRWFSPEQLQYLEKREAIIAKEVKEAAKGSTLTVERPDYLPRVEPRLTRMQLRYWAVREAALAKELKDSNSQSSHHYLPLASRTSGIE